MCIALRKGKSVDDYPPSPLGLRGIYCMHGAQLAEQSASRAHNEVLCSDANMKRDDFVDEGDAFHVPGVWATMSCFALHARGHDFRRLG